MRCCRKPPRSRYFRARNGAQQRPTYRDAEPAIIEAALTPFAAPAVGQLVRLRRQRDVRTNRPFGTVGRRRRDRRVARHGRRLARRPCGVSAPRRRPDHRNRRLRRVDLPVAWTAAVRQPRIRVEAAALPRRRRAGLGAPGPCRRRRSRSTQPVIPTRPRGFAARRGHPAGRHLRAGGRHRQPARPVARRLVSPVLVHPAGGPQRARGR